MRKPPRQPRWLPLTLLTAVLAGCTVGPDYQRPDLALPEQWPEPVRLSMDEQLQWANWWQRYQDPVLDQLVSQALSDNLQARIALVRIQEARAQLGLAEANRWPTIDAQLGASRGETTPDSGPRTLYSIAGVLGYEADLWGRLSRATESAQAQLLQVSVTEEALRLSLVTDVATTYFSLRAAERQVRTAEATIESRRQAFSLEESRFRNGASTELALRQSEAELAQAQAQLPQLQRQAAQLRRALAILVGAEAERVISPEALPEVQLTQIAFDTRLPQRLPSELLERRPDIRAAEAGLMAANANIGVAKAAWFPRLNFAASVGGGASELGDVFSSAGVLWQLSGSLLAPLFDFGRRQALYDTAVARRDIAELQYRATIRDAFREVGDAWTLLQTATARLEALNRQVAALSTSVDLAQRRYENGYSALLEVLDARRALFAAELAQSEAVRDRLAATATLFKALGGGWE